MADTDFSWKEFSRMPIVAIVRNIAWEELQIVLPLFVKAGLTTIEITMNTPKAEDIIRYAVKQYGDRLNVGAGTVCTRKELDRAIGAGARFIVTPMVDEDVIRESVKRNVSIFPGAFTPTEIFRAWNAGADMVKLFPATSLGTHYIKDIMGPFDGIRLLPTGGINIDNLTAFLDAGASGVGIGSELFDKKLMRDMKWEALFEHFKRFVNVVVKHSEKGS